MTQLLIQNKGLVEVEAFQLMGASTKRDDNTKIGMFGSGNKFAIACLLRNKIDIKVYAGLTEIKITTKKKHFRGQDFDVILFNGAESSLTLQMGKDWEVWQALRELYANALDEEYALMVSVDNIEPMEDYTNIYIDLSNPQVKDFIKNKSKYFAVDTKEIFANNIGRILPKTGSQINIFRKGIKCDNEYSTSLFDYDLYNISINESRILERNWDVAENMWNLIFECDKAIVINKFINSWKPNMVNQEVFNQEWENERARSCMVDLGKTTIISDKWKELLSDKWFVPNYLYDLATDSEKQKCYIVGVDIYVVLKYNMGKESILPPSLLDIGDNGSKTFQQVDPTGIQEQVYVKAIDFINDSGLPIFPHYSIIVGRFSDPDVMGSVIKVTNTIVVGTGSLDKGVHETVNTIIEEYIHLKSGAPDCTRHFQTASIDELINYIKVIKNIIL